MGNIKQNIQQRNFLIDQVATTCSASSAGQSSSTAVPLHSLQRVRDPLF